jgi:hypothetical protein
MSVSPPRRCALTNTADEKPENRDPDAALAEEATSALRDPDTAPKPPRADIEWIEMENASADDWEDRNV